MSVCYSFTDVLTNRLSLNSSVSKHPIVLAISLDMLKDKVFIKSTAYPFSKIFHFGQANRVCRFCKKIFCCSECRDRHVDKIHPNLNADCSLCASEILPMRQCEFAKLNVDDEKLLCHIVDKHLPLYCRLCGDLFESREDFKSIGTYIICEAS